MKNSKNNNSLLKTEWKEGKEFNNLKLYNRIAL